MKTIKEILYNLKTIEGTFLIGAGVALLLVQVLNVVPIIAFGIVGYGAYKVVTK